MGNAAYKILANIILEKIKPHVGNIISDYQNGFRDGRSVIDKIFALKIINEKTWEYNHSVHYLFIDFQKAYDSVRRDTLWKCMEEFKIPKELINMCRTCVRPRNRRQDEVTKDGRLVGGTGWRERVHNRKEWKKLLRMARNRRILHVPMNELINLFIYYKKTTDLQTPP